MSFIKFSIIGGIASSIVMLFSVILIDIIQINVFNGFLIASTSTIIISLYLNIIFSFNFKTILKKKIITTVLKYILINLIGSLIYAISSNYFYENFYQVTLISSLFGILIAVLWNYNFSIYWKYRLKDEKIESLLKEHVQEWIIKEDACLLIPTMNEEASIKDVINEALQYFPIAKIIVIDNSKDSTRSILDELNINYVIQKSKGKGNAIIEILPIIKNKWIIMIDGDGTYPLENNIEKLIVYTKSYEAISGNRFTKLTDKNAINRLHWLGNKFLSMLASLVSRNKINDLLTGFRIVKTEIINSLYLNAQEFEIETEYTLKLISNGYSHKEVPIKYLSRSGSESKLSSFSDGNKILSMIMNMMIVYFPAKFFGFTGFVFMYASLIIGLIPIAEFISVSEISRFPSAILAASGVIFGTVVIITGIILEGQKRQFIEFNKVIQKVMK